jgi:hypothetical protein
MSWIKKVTVLKSHELFQQDGKPAHNSHLVLNNRLSDNMKIFWSNWPPNSPNLNPLDYYIYGLFKMDTNKSRHPNFAYLQKVLDSRNYEG